MGDEKNIIPDFEVEDGENYNSLGSSLGITSIALEQFRRCSTEGSQVMDDKQFDKWINCIDRLSDITLPYQIEEADLNKEIEELEKQIEDVLNSLTNDFSKNMERRGDMEKTITAFYEIKKMKLLPLYKKKFRLLSTLFNRRNYFGEESVSGGYS